MSLSVRSFFRTHRSRSKNRDVPQQASISSMIVSPPSLAQLPLVNEEKLPNNDLSPNDQKWMESVESQPYAANISCCGGDEKRKSIKTPVKTARMVKETVQRTQAIANPMEPSDHKILTVTQQQQQAPKVEIDDDLKDLFGKKEITKAMIDQLALRAMTGSMNSNNDDPPRLCTKKHVGSDSIINPKDSLQSSLGFGCLVLLCQ